MKNNLKSAHYSTSKISSLFYRSGELYNIRCKGTRSFGANLESTDLSPRFLLQSMEFLFSSAHCPCPTLLGTFLNFLPPSVEQVALIFSCKVSKEPPCKVSLAPGRRVSGHRSLQSFLSPRPLGRRERTESRCGQLHLMRRPSSSRSRRWFYWTTPLCRR